MKSVKHTGKTLLMTTLAIGCMALVLLWPQWRDEVRAQVSPGSQVSCSRDVDCPRPFNRCNRNSRTCEVLNPCDFDKDCPEGQGCKDHKCVDDKCMCVCTCNRGNTTTSFDNPTCSQTACAQLDLNGTECHVDGVEASYRWSCQNQESP
jgi:hypothetical protein